MSALVPWLRRRFAWSNSRQAWLDRLTFLGLAAAAVLLVLLAPRLAVAAQVLLWALFLIATAFAGRLFGPVLFFDLVRTARRNRYYVIRVLYALALLGLLCWLYFVSAADRDFADTVRPEEAADFANRFFYLFISAQFLIVTVVTPAYVAGAIAEEKERRTLEFLLATDLQDREIVLSKLAARLFNLMLLVLTGLPVLAALQFLGGIDPLLVIAGFAATLLTVASLAGLSMLASVVCRRARDAIVLTYLLAAAYLALSGLSWLLTLPIGWAAFPGTQAAPSPITVEDLVKGFNVGNIVAVLIEMRLDMGMSNQSLDAVLPGYLRNYALFHGAIALIGSLWAVLRLRAVALKETSEPAPRPRRAGVSRRRRPIGDHPMIWKEVFARRGPRGHWLGRATVVLLVLASFVPIAVITYMFLEGTLTASWGIDDRNDELETLAAHTQLWVVRVAGTAVACLLLMAVAVRASSAVSIERDRQTFDGLLTTPLDSDAILFAKWLGALLSVRRGWWWLGALWAIGLLTGGLHPLALVLLVATWFVYAAFLAGLGTWFSVVSRTTLRATTWTLLCAVAAAMGHWVIWMCCTPLLILRSDLVPEFLGWVAEYQAGLTPPLNLGWFASFRAGEFAGDTNRPGEIWELAFFGALGTATWAVLAAVLWVMASRRFRRLTGRMAMVPERSVPQRHARPSLAGVETATGDSSSPNLPSPPYSGERGRG
jgi:ABC-type transport system involved in multi-copper enzyme maturation permease subunit